MKPLGSQYVHISLRAANICLHMERVAKVPWKAEPLELVTRSRGKVALSVSQRADSNTILRHRLILVGKRRHVKVCLTSSQERDAPRMTANRIRSVTRRSHVRIASGIMSRAPSPVDRTCHEKIRRTGERQQLRRRQMYPEPLRKRHLGAARRQVLSEVVEQVHDPVRSRS